MRWHKEQDRDSRARDRRIDAEGDPAFDAYNAWLSGLGSRPSGR